MNKAAKIISDAILGVDYKTVVVNGKAYTVNPPTIAVLAGVARHFSALDNGDSLRDILMSFKDMKKACSALSWLIQGDDGLTEELAQGSFSEIVESLDEGLSLINVEDFIKLSTLVRSVLRLTAKQR
ncbi:MAG: hypothetical protein J6A59_05750 [Lachnospiraceae bacterium]|nr:hypothetical protein [Lachnospiraceae bacterium]MBO5407468.1 hypothetical protein [Bacteroidales bacterium]